MRASEGGSSRVSRGKWVSMGMVRLDVESNSEF